MIRHPSVVMTCPDTVFKIDLTRALGQTHQPVDDLLRALPTDDGATHRAVRDADAGEQETQVVVDLRDGADRGSRVPGGGLLVDGDRGREPLDEVAVRLVHLPQELAGVGGQGLDVASLPLGEDGVEGQRGLARPAQPRENDQGIPGQVQGDVLQVVDAGTSHEDSALSGSNIHGHTCYAAATTNPRFANGVAKAPRTGRVRARTPVSRAAAAETPVRETPYF